MDYNPLVKEELSKLPKNLYWAVPKDAAEFLKQTVIRLKPKTILEIGTSSGYSALWMAEGIIESNMQDNSRIITIESHPGRFEFASQNFAKAGVIDLVKQIKGHAPEAIPKDLQFDMAFFDGTKWQTASFFDAVWHNLAPNGEILVDNMISHAPKMVPFYEHLDSLNIKYETLNIGDGLCRIVKA